MSDLYNKLKKQTDETTTSADIASTPQMITPPIKPAPMIQTGKRKKRRKLGVLQEDVDHQVEKIHSEILSEFNKVINDSGLTIDKFVSTFGVKENITADNVLARYGHALDMLRLKKTLPTELGENEMILDALKNKQTLARFDYAADYPYIYGAKLKSSLNGVTIIYDGYIESGYNEFETITLSDVDVAEKAEDELSNVKVSGSTLFPTKGYFDDEFYKDLKDLLLSYDDEEEKNG